MSDAMTQERIVLKVLSGVQAGAEVSLPAGEYAIGSGLTDDLQFVDVSLKPGHARLKVAAGKMEVMALSGSLTTTNGLSLGAGTETWQELEPLDIVTVGTIRFALGPATANWTSLNDTPEDRQAKPQLRSRYRTAERGPKRAGGSLKLFQLAFPIALLAMVGAGIWYIVAVSGHAGAEAVAERRSDVDVLREAFDKFPFGKAIVVKQEVDGTIYASGYVESPVERRALMGSAEKLGESVRFRLNVLQTMRSEVDNLIKSAKLPLTFTLGSSGDLALDGLILNDEAEKKFVDQLKTDVIGIGSIDDRIRTSKTLLAEIEKLIRLAQIDTYIVVRLDNDLIEVNGVLPVDKIDAWVGFLQSYTRRFSKDIALRSFVQLQTAAGVVVSQAEPVPGQAITVGERKPGSNDIVLDIERLKRGLFDLSDVFIGVDKRKQTPGNLTLGTLDPPVPGLKITPPVNPDGSVPVAQAPGKPAATSAVPGTPTAQLTTPPALPPTSISIEETPESPEKTPADLPGAPKPSAAGTGGVVVIPSAKPGDPAAKPGDPAVTNPGSTPNSPNKEGIAGQRPGAPGGGPIGGPQPNGVAIQPAAPNATASATPGVPTTPGSPAAMVDANGQPVQNSGDPATPSNPNALQPATSASAENPNSPAAVAAANGPKSAVVEPERHIEEIANLIVRANSLIRGWLTGKPSADASVEDNKNLRDSLDRLAVTRASLDEDRAAPKKVDRATLAVRYLPLFSSDASRESKPADACWPGSRLTARNLPVALFWLDLLSVSSSLSIDELGRDEQGFILEAALNPTAARQCLQHVKPANAAAEKSLYLAEAARNPDFIRFITRNFKPAQLEVSGANLSGIRFIQTRDGYKMREGVAPDGLSRIAMVGELGVALRLDSGYSTVIYGRDLNWMLSQN